MKTQMVLSLPYLGREKLLVYLRASLPSVPIQTLRWTVLVKRGWRCDVTADLQGCLSLTVLSVLCLCFLHCFFCLSAGDFRDFHLLQYICSQGVFVWIFSAEKFRLREPGAFLASTRKTWHFLGSSSEFCATTSQKGSVCGTVCSVSIQTTDASFAI